jgi:hypothetical protein
VFGKTLALALNAASVESAPLYSFSYQATTSYNTVETFSGDHFYDLDFPRINLEGRYCLRNRHCGWFVLDSGYQSAKQSQQPQIRITHQLIREIRDNVFFQFKPTLALGGQTQLSPCVDAIGRKFHCYFGTQQSSSLFFKSYDDIAALYHVPFVRVTQIEVSLTWIF